MEGVQKLSITRQNQCAKRIQPTMSWDHKQIHDRKIELPVYTNLIWERPKVSSNFPKTLAWIPKHVWTDWICWKENLKRPSSTGHVLIQLKVFESRFLPARPLKLALKMGLGWFVDIFTGKRVQKPRTEAFLVFMFAFTSPAQMGKPCWFWVYRAAFTITNLK